MPTLIEAFGRPFVYVDYSYLCNKVDKTFNQAGPNDPLDAGLARREALRDAGKEREVEIGRDPTQSLPSTKKSPTQTKETEVHHEV